MESWQTVKTPDISDFTFIKVFPNPTWVLLNLQLSGLTANADIRIFDSNGETFLYFRMLKMEKHLDITFAIRYLHL